MAKKKKKQSKRANRKSKKRTPRLAPEDVAGQRELIVMAHEEVGLRVTSRAITAEADIDVAPLKEQLKSMKVSMRPLFGMSERRIAARTEALAESSNASVPELSVYYQVDVSDKRMDEVAEALLDQDVVAAAYVKPPTELPALANDKTADVNRMRAKRSTRAKATPLLVPEQGYMADAPGGIGVRCAWALPGGRGEGISVVDMERGWNFQHEDLQQNNGGLISGTINPGSRNHGTAVMGEIGGDSNFLGVTGISPKAKLSAISYFTRTTSETIIEAANKLKAGDLLLLEVHRGGPNATGSGQFGYIGIEWWPDDFAAIRYAVAKGIIVVEAAGNGSQNLDASIYNKPLAGFPSTWKNPFNPLNPSSEAVLVGAGAPPSGNFGPDRSRLGFSCYGKRVDAQGWGREVVTTGYGDLFNGGNDNRLYTETFSGTSSASPIVTGALACAQGILKKAGLPLLTPASAIKLLRSTGSPQQSGPSAPKTQRIGNRPNLCEMVKQLI